VTDIPLRQDVAMTGAIDQMGNVLAIGAANEKIEGFYDVCADGGLTGTQGVIIPRANAADLMLREDVVKSCAQRQFFVYVAESVYEAIEILTGIPAGHRDRGGRYPEGTLLCRAMNRAHEYWIKAVGTAPLVEEVEE